MESSEDVGNCDVPQILSLGGDRELLQVAIVYTFTALCRMAMALTCPEKMRDLEFDDFVNHWIQQKATSSRSLMVQFSVSNMYDVRQ